MDSLHFLNPVLSISYLLPHMRTYSWLRWLHEKTQRGIVKVRYRKWWHVCHIYTLFKHNCAYLHFFNISPLFNMVWDLIQQLHDRFTCLRARCPTWSSRTTVLFAGREGEPSTLNHSNLWGRCRVCMKQTVWTETLEGQNVPLQHLNRRHSRKRNGQIGGTSIQAF